MNGGVSNKRLVLAAMVFAVAGTLSSSTPGAGSTGGQPRALVHDVQLAFAHSIQTIFYIMAGVMAASFLVAVRRLPRGRVQTTEEPEVPVSPAGAGA